MIDTEKLRALLADAAEMGLKLPVESIGIAVRDIERRELCCLYDEPWGALIAAAVNALPELLDALATAAQVSDRVQTIADEDFGPFPTEPADTCLTYIERGIFGLRQALATAEAERLTLARALPRCSVPTCTSKAVVNARVDGRTPHNPGPAYRAWFCVECIAARPHTSECVSATWDVDIAARIVAEADAAAAGKGQQR